MIGMKTLGLKTLGVKTLGMKTLGMKTLGMKTLGMKTLGMKTLGMKTNMSCLYCLSPYIQFYIVNFVDYIHSLWQFYNQSKIAPAMYRDQQSRPP